LLSTIQTDLKSMTLDLTKYPTGIYVVEVKSGDGKQVTRQLLRQ